MDILFSVFISIFNAYILYNIFNTKGYNYALMFCFVWDMISFALSYFKAGLEISLAIGIIVSIGLSSLIKVSIDYYAYKKTKSFNTYLIFSTCLGLVLSFVLSLLLVGIVSLF